MDNVRPLVQHKMQIEMIAQLIAQLGYDSVKLDLFGDNLVE